MDIIGHLGNIEAPGALNTAFLKELRDRPKGPVWPKVPIYWSSRTIQGPCQASRDLDPGHLSRVQVYVSVPVLSLVRSNDFCQLKSTYAT